MDLRVENKIKELEKQIVNEKGSSKIYSLMGGAYGL